MSYHLDIANFPVESLVNIVADLLNSIVETNDRLMMPPIPSTATTSAATTATVAHIATDSGTFAQPVIVTRFHSRAVPKIDVHSYLTRILKFAPFSNEVLLSLLIYFDRIARMSNKTTVYAVNSLTVHRLLITSIVVASKFTSDIFYPNRRYAKVGGIPVKELNQLELEFLFLCNFDLHVKMEELQAYGNHLLTHALARDHDTLSPASFLHHQRQQQEQYQERRMAFLSANNSSLVAVQDQSSKQSSKFSKKKKRKITNSSDDAEKDDADEKEGVVVEGKSAALDTPVNPRKASNTHDKRLKRRKCVATMPNIERSQTASLSPSGKHHNTYCTTTKTEPLSGSRSCAEKPVKNPLISTVATAAIAAAAAASDSAALLSRTILYSAVVSSPKTQSHSYLLSTTASTSSFSRSVQ